MSDPTSPDAAVQLGRQVSARLQPMHLRRRTRVAPEHRAGMVAGKAARFGFLNGRSVLARRMLGQNVTAGVQGTDLLPVGMQLDLWLAVAERERQRMRPTPSRLEQNMQTAQRRMLQRKAPRGFAAEAAAAGPRGLPRATSRGRLSPAGIDTGPSSASHRMLTEAAFVANPDEVRAAGPMLGRRDLARAVARRSTVGPPSPPTGGGRARRSAQASEPGRQIGSTRPDADDGATPHATRAVGEVPRVAPSEPASIAPAPVTSDQPPRAMSLPPITLDANDGGYPQQEAQWLPLPRPGALARRGALAAELRRVPRDVRRTIASAPSTISPIATTAMGGSISARLPFNTMSLPVAPTIEGAAAAASLSSTRTPVAPPPAPASAASTPAAPASSVPASAASAPSASTPAAQRVANGSSSRIGATPPARPQSPAWSVAATAYGDIPVSLFGPAAPAQLRRARSLGAAPAPTNTPAGMVRRALAPVSSWSTRPNTLVRPAVSTTDHSLRGASVAAAPLDRHPTAGPVLRSVANAMQRAVVAREPASQPTPLLASPESTSGLSGRQIGRVAPTSPSPVPVGLQIRRLAEATPMSMPPRPGEAPVPPLPLAVAFAQRATAERPLEMLPLAARGRVRAADVARTPAGRVPSMLAGFDTSTVRRSRFGAAIAAPVASTSWMSSPTSPTSSASPSRVSSASMPLSRRAVSASLPVAHISAVAPPPTVASPRSTDATGSSRPTALPNGELRRAIGAPDTATPLAPSALTPPLPGVAASSAGARFLAALHEAPVDPVRPVPARFAPLARAIAGPRPVAVRSGPSTTRALGRAGKRAATVGNVVHLPSSPVTAPPSAEVFAHELVHAARPSPVPRFFDDDRHSPEEDLARAAGSLMRAVQPPTDAGQGPAEFIRRQAAADSRTPTFGTAGLAVGASGGLMSALAGATPATPAANSPAAKDDEIRRSRAGRAAAERRKTRPATTTSSSPSSSAARSSSSSLPSPTTTIFRSVAGSGIVRRELDSSGAPGSSIFGSNGAIAGAGNHDDGNTPVAGGLLPSLGAAGQSANKVSNSNSPAENELIERIIDAIEERVIAELERRGRRHHPGVF